MTVDELVVNIKANISGFTGKINEARQQISQVGQSAQSGAKDIQSMSSTAGSAASSMKNSFAGIAKAAVAAFSIKKLVDFGKESLELASDLQEVQNVVDTSFGDMSAQVDAWAKTTIDKFGMSETSAKRTASTYMAMSKGMGQYGEAAADMAIKAAERTGDIASFYNMSQSEADTMMKSIWTGETESLKRIGVVMTQTNLDAYALANGFGKTTDAMTQAEQVQLRYQYVMEQTSLAAGDFEKTGGGWANQVRVLSERFDQLKTSIGSAIMQVALPVLQALNSVMSKVVSVANEVANALSGLFGTPKAETAAVANNTEQALDAQQALTSEVKKTGDAAKKAAAGFDEMTILSSQKSSGGTESAAVTTGGGVSLDGSALETIGEQSETLGKLKKFLEPLSKISFKPLIDSLKKLGQAMKPLGQTLFKGLEWAYKNIFAPLSKLVIETVLPGFLDILSVAVSGLDTALNGIGGIIGSVGEQFAPAFATWGEALTGLGEPLNAAFAKVGETVSGLWNNTMLPFSEYVLGDFVPSIFGSFTETFAPIFSDILPVAFDEFSKDFEFVAGVVNDAVNDIFKPAMEQAKLVATDAMNSIKENWEERGQSILEKFQQMKESFRELWDHLYNGIIKPVIDNVINKAKELWENHLKPLWDNLVEFFMSLQECVMTIWNNFLKPIVDWLITVLGPVVKNVINGIVNVVMTVVGVVSDVVSGVIKFARGLLDFITGVFSGDWDKAWNGIKDSFKGIWDAIWGVVKGVINLIIDGLNLLWGAIYGVVSGIVNGIGSIAEALGELLGQDWGFTMPEEPPLIPKLMARGGIVTEATHAVIGEAGKEAVLPLENNTEWMDILAERINGGTPERLVLQVGETVLGEVVLNSLNSLTRQRGGLDLVMA